MKLTPPAGATWVVAVMVGLLGLLLHFHVLRLPGLTVDPFWLVTAAAVLLAVASFVKGL
jgi:ABC-type uncharacterized transport system permease subunit